MATYFFFIFLGRWRGRGVDGEGILVQALNDSLFFSPGIDEI